MPGITARICGICPVSHLLASSKACDAIMAVRIPPAAAAIREAIHCGQYIQSHALSFFHLYQSATGGMCAAAGAAAAPALRSRRRVTGSSVGWG